MYTHMHAHAHVQSYAHTCTHMHTHAHTHADVERIPGGKVCMLEAIASSIQVFVFSFAPSGYFLLFGRTCVLFWLLAI